MFVQASHCTVHHPDLDRYSPVNVCTSRPLYGASSWFRRVLTCKCLYKQAVLCASFWSWRSSRVRYAERPWRTLHLYMFVKAGAVRVDFFHVEGGAYWRRLTHPFDAHRKPQWSSSSSSSMFIKSSQNRNSFYSFCYILDVFCVFPCHRPVPFLLLKGGH